MRAQDTPLPIETILGSFATAYRDTELVSPPPRAPVVARSTQAVPLAAGSAPSVETSSDRRAR